MGELCYLVIGHWGVSSCIISGRGGSKEIKLPKKCLKGDVSKESNVTYNMRFVGMFNYILIVKYEKSTLPYLIN